jgi:hypothetical protein
MADSFIASEIAAQELRNRALIAAIEDEGADLHAKRQIDFFFYTTERADADALAADPSRPDSLPRKSAPSRTKESGRCRER